MRLPIAAALFAALLAPASAHAATVALEGTEVVYRADAGQRDAVSFEDDAGVLTVGRPAGP